MGGGVGVSIGSMFRVATEKLVFAMPEVWRTSRLLKTNCIRLESAL